MCSCFPNHINNTWASDTQRRANSASCYVFWMNFAV